MLAVVLPYNIHKETAGTWGLVLSNRCTRMLEIIDVQTIDKVVGRLQNRRELAFLEKMGLKQVLEVLDNPETIPDPDMSLF